MTDWDNKIKTHDYADGYRAGLIAGIKSGMEQAAQISDRWATTYRNFNNPEIQDIARVDVCEAIANEIRKEIS